MCKKIMMIAMLMLFFSSCAQNENELIPLEENKTEAISEDDADINIKNDSIFVYVCGAVRQEGVYELPVGSRVFEAIEYAGGFLENAAITQINQAEVLEDEMRLYVPTLEEMVQIQVQDDGKVNLNTATKAELMELPGVGEAKADSIISFRESNGKFKSVEEIMQISGIKEGLFNKIKDYIKI